MAVLRTTRFQMLSATLSNLPCEPIHLPKRGIGPAGAVCRCNSTFCDSIAPIGTIPANGFVQYATTLAVDRERLTRSEGTFAQQRVTTSSSAASTTHSIFVNASARFQTVTGFGAAFTDAAVLGFHALTPGAQANLLRSYWGEGGLQYSLGRVPIGGTDFSTSVYSYDDSIDDDLNLTRFSIDVDERSGKLPLVRAALARSKSSSSSSSNGSRNSNDGSVMRLFASCWGPPAWMTTRNSTLNATLRDRPGGPIHRAYAKYLSRFVSEYAAAGVNIWAVTTGNEPTGNGGKWQDLRFTAAMQRDWLARDLGPIMRAEQPQTKLLMLDDQRTHLPKWADVVLADDAAAKYVDGIGVHWYAQLLRTPPC